MKVHDTMNRARTYVINETRAYLDSLTDKELAGIYVEYWNAILPGDVRNDTFAFLFWTYKHKNLHLKK